jgi:hypothetical protein
MWGLWSYLQTALVQPMRTLGQSHDHILLLVLQVRQIKRSEDPKLDAHIVETDRATLVTLGVTPLFEGTSWQRVDNRVWSVSRSHFTDGRGQR